MSAVPDNFVWSFTKLSTFDHCPMAFKLEYIDKVKQDGNAFSDYGTFCHKLIERWAKGEVPEIALAEEYENGYSDALCHHFPPFPRDMPLKYYEQGLRYFENFNGFGDESEIIAVEDRFRLNIKGYPFSGVADLVLRNRNSGAITVIDHKSKSASQMKKDLSTYGRQLYVYAAYVKEKFGEYPKLLRFNLFRENQFVTLDFDPKELDETMDWIVRTIERIKSVEDWNTNISSFYCKFVCSVVIHCPAIDDIFYGKEKV